MKIRLLTIAMLFAITVFAQKEPSEQVKIEGLIKDQHYNNTYILAFHSINGLTDSALVKEGKYTFQIPYSEPTQYFLISKYELERDQKYNPFSLLVTEPGEILVETQQSNYSKSDVKGSKENDLLHEFIQVSNSGKKNILDSLYLRYGRETIDSIKKDDPMFPEIATLYQELNKSYLVQEKLRIADFIKANPNSFSAVYILASSQENLEIEKLDSLYHLLGNTYRNSALALSLKSKIDEEKKMAIGQVAPLFSQADTNGKVVHLKDFRGHYILIDFWASWCGPCRAENPNVAAAYQKYHSKGFQILGVSLDQPNGKSRWIDAIHSDGLSWTQVSDLKGWKNEVALLYGVKSIPQNFLLNPEGKIVAKNLRGSDLEEKLQEIYGK